MQAQPPRHRPYDKHSRKQVVHLYFVSGAWSAQPLLDGSADVLAGRLSSGSSRTTGCIVQSTCPRKGFLRSHRKHDAVASQLLVSIVQDDMQVWHMLALHIPCHACTHIHGRGDQDAHLPCSPPVCWQQLLCAYEEGGCLRLTAQAPAVSLAPSARGWALRPLSLPIITITFAFVLFCFVLFSLFCFSRGHNWDIVCIPASRHNEYYTLLVNATSSLIDWRNAD